MSAPGAPPETGSDVGYGGLETPPEEDRLPPNAMPTTNLFDSNMVPLTADERFMPGTAPNMAGQITPPDRPIISRDAPTPGRFAAPAPGPPPPPDGATLPTPAAVPGPRQPVSKTSLFSPVPVAQQQYTIRRRDDKFYKGQLDPESEREQTRPIRGGVPSARALKGTLSPNAQSWFEFSITPREQGGLGLSPVGAAGVVANLTVESYERVDPTVEGDNGASVGAAQWQKDRRRQLESLPNPRTTNTQQRHMHNELNGPYRAVYERLLQAKTPEEAALIFGRGYERYGDEKSTKIRTSRAKQIHQMMTGGGASVITPSKTGISTNVEPVYGPNLSPNAPVMEAGAPKRQQRPFSLLSPEPAAEQMIPIGRPQGRLARSIATDPNTIADLKYKFQQAKDFQATTQRVATVPQAPQPYQQIQPPNAAAVITAPTATDPTTGGQSTFVPQEQPLTGVHPVTGRPLIYNEKGGPSTESTITVTDDSGKYVNIPTIVNGKRKTNKAAVKLWREGKNSPVGGGPYDTLDEAIAAAKQRSIDLGRTLPAEVQQPQIVKQKGKILHPLLAKPGEPGPVYAPAETPAEELTRLSQTPPWKSRGGRASFDKYQPKYPVTSVEPSKMLPTRPLDPKIQELIAISRGTPVIPTEEIENQRMLAEEAATELSLARTEPRWDEPLYETPQMPTYVPEELRTTPTAETLATQPMPISPETLPAPAPAISYGPATPVDPRGFSRQTHGYIVPQQDLSIDEAGQPGINPTLAEMTKQTLLDITRGQRWFAQGAVSGLSQLPFMLSAGISALESLPYALVTGAPSQAAQNEIMARLEAANKIERATKGWFGFGADEQASGAEWVDKTLGESMFPANKVKAVILGTSLMAGARGLIDPHSPFTLISPAEAQGVTVQDRAPGKAAKKNSEKQQGEDNRITMPEVPGQIQQGNIVAGAIPGPVIGTQVPHPDDPGSIILIPNMSIYGPMQGRMNLTPEQAVAQFARTGLNFGTFNSEAAAHKYLEILNSRVTQTVQGASGPTQLRTQDLAVLGTMGALTIGMAGGPHLYRIFTHGKMARPLTLDRGRALNIAEGPQNTYAFTSHKDYLRTMVDDFHAAKFANMRRAGASPEEINRMENAFYGHTRGAATNLAQSAVVTGRAHTPEFNFELLPGARPLGDLQRFDSPTVREYLYLWNTLDEINAAAKKTPNQASLQGPVQPGRQIQVGPPTVRDLDAPTVQSRIRVMETQEPSLRDIRLDFQATKHEAMRVASEGRWATWTKKDAQKEVTDNLNRIDYGDEHYGTTSPFNRQGSFVHKELRSVMENQANGEYILMMNRLRPGMFTEITSTQKAQNSSWEKNTVTVYEYGKPKYYVTDPLIASTMKIDPMYHSNPMWNTGMRMLTAPKRAAETTTTGWANPKFALTNGPRNFMIQLVTAHSQKLTPAGPLAWAAAIPRILIPQFTNGIAKSIDFGVIKQTLGPRMPAWVDALGKRWAATYPESIHAQLQMHGGHYGSTYDYRPAGDKTLNTAILQSTGKARQMLGVFKNIVSSIHDAAPVAVAAKNRWRTRLPESDPRHMSMFELTRRKRALTGDPTIQGEFFGGAGPIRFHTDTMTGDIARMGIKGAGGMAEAARVIGMWFNPTAQGIKSITRAYWRNPAKFTAAMWLSQGLPAGLAYMWNASLGLDPQGQSYVLHQMQGRSPYNSMLNWYLGVPGRPAAEGWEIPGPFHELSIVKRWTEIGIDHMYRDPSQNWKEDFQRMVDMWLGVTTDLPMPPMVNAFFGARGITTTGGAMSGDSYKRRDFPYDQNAGLPVNYELAWRAIHGAAADMFVAGILAGMQEENKYLKPASALKEMGKQQLRGAPFLRNVFDMTPPAAGNTQIGDEMFKYRGIINKLDEYFRNYEYGGGRRLSNKPGSKAGGPLIESQIGPFAPEIAPGMPQPTTTNPLYNAYMQMLHNRITKDDPKTGGMGYKTMLKQYYKTTKELATLRNITGANYAVWQQWMNDPRNEELRKFLKLHNVDTTNKTAVQNFYQLRRQNAMNVMLHMFKSTEKEIERRTGKPFKLKDLDPYLKMNDIADWTPKNTVIDLISGEYFAGTAESPGGLPTPGSMNP